jgi:transcriptional regulator GlxA family with amidase domain
MPSRRVVIVVFPGLQILDATGPAAVFGQANRELGRQLYRVEIASRSGKLLEATGGVVLGTRALADTSERRIDTLLVAGGDEAAIVAALADRSLRRWLLRAAPHARRLGSVCSGAFVLAGCGFLNDRRAATHWNACARLARRFPRVSVDADALYVVDGKLWTSAGVTTGIDMALSMVEADVGVSVANAVARSLVLYARRPGYQSQFSAVLSAQRASAEPYAELVEWLSRHLERAHRVEQLAKRVGQSTRDFHRKFSSALGQTPARFVENLRLERARLLLSHERSLKDIARQTGFGSALRMSRAFERRYGVKPSLLRELVPHGARASTDRARVAPRSASR